MNKGQANNDTTQEDIRSFLDSLEPTYPELKLIHDWVEREFKKSHKRSMEPEQTRFKEPYT